MASLHLDDSIDEKYDRLAAIVRLPAAQGLSEHEKSEILAPYIESERAALVEIDAYLARQERQVAAERRQHRRHRRRERLSDLWWMVRMEMIHIVWARALIRGYKRAAKRVCARVLQVLRGPGNADEEARKRRRLASSS